MELDECNVRIVSKKLLLFEVLRKIHILLQEQKNCVGSICIGMKRIHTF